MLAVPISILLRKTMTQIEWLEKSIKIYEQIRPEHPDPCFMDRMISDAKHKYENLQRVEILKGE
jgi:hypothetical protein